MSRLLMCLTVLLITSTTLANGDDWIRDQEKTKIKAEKNLEKRQQRQEVLDADDLGGAKSGEMEEKSRHDEEKQKFLNQHDGYYRKGL